MSREVRRLSNECDDLRHKLDVKNQINDCAHTEISALVEIVTNLQSKVFELEDLANYREYGTLPESMICYQGKVNQLLESTDELIAKQPNTPKLMTPKGWNQECCVSNPTEQPSDNDACQPRTDHTNQQPDGPKNTEDTQGPVRPQLHQGGP